MLEGGPPGGDGRRGAGPPHDVVAVLRDREVRGLSRFSDRERAAPLDPCITLREALEREWSSDAHLLCYLVEQFDPVEPVYRLNKPVLREIYAAGAWVASYLICIDLDTAGHIPWTPEAWGEFQCLLRDLPEAAKSRLAQACASYSTRRGFRWIFRLSHGVFEAQVEPLVRGLQAELVAGGLPVDRAPVLAAWNTCFRLPRVLRDGSRSSDDPFFTCYLDLDASVDPDSISPVGVVGEEVAGASDAEMPSFDEAKEFRQKRAEKGQPETSFFRAMKRDMRGQYWYSICFEHGVLVSSPGKARHDVLRDWILSCAPRVMDYRGETTTPAHLYALFAEATEQLHEEERSRGWPREVWRLCVGAWSRAQGEMLAQAREEVEERRDEAERGVESADRIIATVGSWYPGLPREPPLAWEWIRGRLILKARGGLYVMKKTGYYSTFATDVEGLIPRIVQLGMDSHISIWVEAKGGSRLVRRDEILAVHARNVDRVVYRVGVEGAHLQNPEAEEGLVLVVPPFRRRKDLTPEFSPDVDLWLRAFASHYASAEEEATWLRAFGGVSMFDFFCLHTASMLAFEDGSTAAASFNLAPGSGKKLYTHALLECMEEPDHATGDDLVQRFNSKLATAAFLLVNEGLPEGKGMYASSDTLRRVVTGDYFQSERKYHDAVNVKSAIRAILTANDWRLIDSLGDRDLSPHEQDAIGQRLVHYPTHKTAAADLLRSRGGHAWTKGWIEGDAGEPSRFVVARHFLWLYETFRHKLVLGRLLVEGSPLQSAIQRLRIRGGSTIAVIETIVKILANPLLAVDGSQGVLVEGSKLFVTVGAILDHWRDRLTRGSSDRLTAKRIGMSLKGLVVGEQGKLRSIDGRKARWNEIDVGLLWKVADENGWSAPRLEALVAQRLVEESSASVNGNGHGRVIALEGRGVQGGQQLP